jgi:L-alanine-DL-glutamate epimerase-like enolase superfamily enzyme
MTVREIQMQLVTPFETSMERTDVRRIILVEADVDGAVGWGECVAGENPYYSPEDTDTVWHILKDYLWPTLKNREFSSAAEVWSLLERVRGHNMAKGALEAAIWDAEAQYKVVPLHKLILKDPNFRRGRYSTASSRASARCAIDTDRCFHFGSRKANKPRLILSMQFVTPFSFTLPRQWWKKLPYAELARSGDFDPVERAVLGARN